MAFFFSPAFFSLSFCSPEEIRMAFCRRSNLEDSPERKFLLLLDFFLFLKMRLLLSIIRDNSIFIQSIDSSDYLSLFNPHKNRNAIFFFSIAFSVFLKALLFKILFVVVGS